MVFVPVFVAWIWCHPHNKGTLESTHSVDRRPSTGSSPLLPISLARSGLGSKPKRNRERRQAFGQCYSVGWVIGSNPDNMAPLCRSSNSLVKPPPPPPHTHTQYRLTTHTLISSSHSTNTDNLDNSASDDNDDDEVSHGRLTCRFPSPSSDR